MCKYDCSILAMNENKTSHENFRNPLIFEKKEWTLLLFGLVECKNMYTDPANLQSTSSIKMSVKEESVLNYLGLLKIEIRVCWFVITLFEHCST